VLFPIRCVPSSPFYWLIVFPAASTHWYKRIWPIGISDWFCKLLHTFAFILSQYVHREHLLKMPMLLLAVDVGWMIVFSLSWLATAHLRDLAR
jgi:hypothetical protein